MKAKYDLYGNSLHKGENQKRNGEYRYCCYGGGRRFHIYAQSLKELREKEQSIRNKAFICSYRFHLQFWKLKYISTGKLIPKEKIDKVANRYGISIVESKNIKNPIL